MVPAIKEVNPLANFKLLLTFDNGEKRMFDMRPYLELGIFKELKDIELFQTVKKSFDTVEWANEADLDPEILYLESSRVE